MSIKHLNESDGALTDSIKADLQRVVTTVEKVKTASNTIMDGITVVRELASENKHGSDLVLDGLNELTDNNKQLQNHASSSLDMTTDINSQVENVAGLINEMVSLTAESGSHAQTSSTDLESLVKTSKQCQNYQTMLKIFSLNLRMNLRPLKKKQALLIIFQARPTFLLSTLQ